MNDIIHSVHYEVAYDMLNTLVGQAALAAARVAAQPGANPREVEQCDADLRALFLARRALAPHTDTVDRVIRQDAALVRQQRERAAQAALPDADEVLALGGAAYQRIEALALAETLPATRPSAILLGGQPGSGKSDLAQTAVAALQQHGGAVAIDADQMRELHPQYQALLVQDPQHAADRTHALAGSWANRLSTTAMAHRRHLVIDGTLRNPTAASELVQRLHAAGYEIQVWVMAVRPERSFLRARLRYESQFEVHGAGRFVNREQHDAAYTGLASTVAVLEHEPHVEAMGLFDVRHQPCYSNQRVEGVWRKAAGAGQALQAERQRVPGLRDVREREQMLARVVRLAAMREHQGVAPQDLAQLQAELTQARAALEAVRPAS